MPYDPASDSPVTPRPIERLSRLVRGYLPLLLAGCYLLAYFLPEPGQLAHGWSLPELLPDVLRPRLSHLLVALLLLLAALGIEPRRLPVVIRSPGLLVASWGAVWLAPAAVVVLAWWGVPLLVEPEVASTLIVGFALVAAMPVANSSAAWTQQSRGALSWALSLVVLSIVASPWVIPFVLRMLGLSFSPREAAGLAQLMHSFSGLKFVVWVLFPTGVGMLIRCGLGAARIAVCRQGILLTSAATLLLLNYINAAAAVPQMTGQFSWGLTVASVTIALACCTAGWLVARCLGYAFAASPESVTALGYSLTMKNTGLALALASNVLTEQPVLLLPVFTMTLVQHLFASLLHRGALRRNAT